MPKPITFKERADDLKAMCVSVSDAPILSRMNLASIAVFEAAELIADMALVMDKMNGGAK